jgi:hypothetical protein
MVTATEVSEVEVVSPTVEAGETVALATPMPAAPEMVTATEVSEVEVVSPTVEAGETVAPATPTPAPAEMVTGTEVSEVEAIPATPPAPTEATVTPMDEAVVTATPAASPGPGVPGLAQAPSGVLRNSRPPLSGTAPPAAVIRIYDGETLLGETVADDEGLWYFLPETALAAGAYTLELRTQDSQGAQVPFASIDIRIARDAEPIEPPTLEVIPAGAEVDDVTVLQGHAPPGQLVYVFDGLRVLNVVRARRDGSWQLALPRGLPAGQHQFRVAIQDEDGGLLSESPSIVVSVSPPRLFPTTGTYRADLDPGLR